MSDNNLLKRKKNLKLVVTYTLMSFSVIIILIFLMFFVLGYRFDVSSHQITQYAFLQFNSMPTGATVTVDGEKLSAKTPTKTSLPAGEHTVKIVKDGYETWSKTVSVDSGTLTWLDYAILIPSDLSVESVGTYAGLDQSLASVDGKKIIIHENASSPNFSIADLGSENVKSSIITLPTSTYSEAGSQGVTHTFSIEKWDMGGRYVLVSHKYNDSTEWIVLDTQNIESSKNISKLFNISISEISFLGESGNTFYILNDSDIRKINLSEATISKPLVSNVKSYTYYDETGTISYISASDSDATKLNIGLYRDGDSTPHVIRTVSVDSDVRVISTHYFNEDHVAILENGRVDILSGSYPVSSSADASTLKIYASFETASSVDEMVFDNSGQRLLVQSGKNFITYDIEYKQKTSSVINYDGNTSFDIKWLNDGYLYTDIDGELTIREFDGQNIHKINNSIQNQAVSLSLSDKYIYSFIKTNETYSLQRVKLYN